MRDRALLFAQLPLAESSSLKDLTVAIDYVEMTTFYWKR